MNGWLMYKMSRFLLWLLALYVLCSCFFKKRKNNNNNLSELYLSFSRCSKCLMCPISIHSSFTTGDDRGRGCQFALIITGTFIHIYTPEEPHWMQGGGSVFPKVTMTLDWEEWGIGLPTLWSMVDLLNHLSHCRVLLYGDSEKLTVQNVNRLFHQNPSIHWFSGKWISVFRSHHFCHLVVEKTCERSDSSSARTGFSWSSAFLQSPSSFALFHHHHHCHSRSISPPHIILLQQPCRF